MSSPNSKIPCKQRPCQTIPSSKTEDPNAELSGRPLLFTGVLWIQVMRRFLLPRRDEPCDLLLPQTEDSKPINVSHVSSDHPQIHRSPLQATAPPVSRNEVAFEEITTKHRERIQKKHSQIAELLYQANDQVRQVNNAISDFIDESKFAAKETVSVIRQEDASVFRYGAVTLSGLVGYLLGLRRGAVTRLLYTATGVTAAAAICYPREAVHHNQQALDMVHKLVVIGIEFGRNKPRNDETKVGKKNNLQTPSGHSEAPNTKLHVDCQPTKLTSESFISPENDFKPYHNYYEGSKPKAKNDTLQSPKMDERNSFNKERHPLQGQSEIPNTPFPSSDIPDEDMALGEGAPKASSQPKLPSPQNTVTLDIPYLPNHSESVHKQNNRSDHSELKQKPSNLFGPDVIKDSTEKSECQYKDEVTPGNHVLPMVDELAPKFHVKSEQEVVSYVQLEDGVKDSVKEQHVPLNRKLSQYYKKNLEKTTISTDYQEDNLPDIILRKS